MVDEPFDLEIHPVTPERWPDLERLFGPRGACAGCWCMWWKLSRAEFGRQSREERRKGLKRLAESGSVPGLLAYRGGELAGWCALGPREGYPSLERSRTLKRIDDAPVWSIVCFYVGRRFRRQGITARLIEAAVDYAASRGASTVEAYPVDPTGRRLDSVSAFTGLLPAFTRAGFVEVARRSERRPIVRYTIQV